VNFSVLQKPNNRKSHKVLPETLLEFGGLKKNGRAAGTSLL
jgi:hypothetical protein